MQKIEAPKYHLGAKIGKVKTRINNNFTKEPVKNKNTVKEKNSAEQQVKNKDSPTLKKSDGLFFVLILKKANTSEDYPLSCRRSSLICAGSILFCLRVHRLRVQAKYKDC